MDASNQTGQPLPAKKNTGRPIRLARACGTMEDTGRSPSLDLLGRVGCSLRVSVPHGVAYPMQNDLCSPSEQRTC